MYEAFYELREKPFSILPDPDMIFWGKTHSMAFTMLEFGVMNNAGFTVITGEIGSGKTTLVRHLLKKLAPTISIGLISNTPQGRLELMQWVLMAFNQPYSGEYLDLFKRFQDYLYAQHVARRRVILIIDEAQNLGSETLEHLRMLSNINADKHQILQLILVGQPELRDLLLGPQLVQFVQRISSDFHLRPLTVDEVTQYVSFRLKAAGAKVPLFSLEACNKVAVASGGVPRIINILCDTALVYGYSTGERAISATLIDQVIEDKRQFSIMPLKKDSVEL